MSPSVFGAKIVMEWTKNPTGLVMYRKENIETFTDLGFGILYAHHHQGKGFLRGRRDIVRSGAGISNPLNDLFSYPRFGNYLCLILLPSPSGFYSSFSALYLAFQHSWSISLSQNGIQCQENSH